MSAKSFSQFRLHPLGFFYFQEKIGEGKARRIHVWLDGNSIPPDPDRHLHSFDIQSDVVLGHLRNELFLFHETPSGEVRESIVTYEGNNSALSPTGRVGNLECISAFDTVAGTGYFLKSGVIHQATVLKKPCVTVLTTTNHDVPIYSYGNQSSTVFVRRQVNEEEALQLEYVLSQANLL